MSVNREWKAKARAKARRRTGRKQEHMSKGLVGAILMPPKPIVSSRDLKAPSESEVTTTHKNK